VVYGCPNSVIGMFRVCNTLFLHQIGKIGVGWLLQYTLFLSLPFKLKGFLNHVPYCSLGKLCAVEMLWTALNPFYHMEFIPVIENILLTQWICGLLILTCIATNQKYLYSKLNMLFCFILWCPICSGEYWFASFST